MLEYIQRDGLEINWGNFFPLDLVLYPEKSCVFGLDWIIQFNLNVNYEYRLASTHISSWRCTCKYTYFVACWGLNQRADILLMPFSSVFCSCKYLYFVQNSSLFIRVQFAISHLWFRQWFDAALATLLCHRTSMYHNNCIKSEMKSKLIL